MTELEEELEITTNILGNSTEEANVAEVRPRSPSVFLRTLKFFTDRHSSELTSRQINSIEQLLRKHAAGFVSITLFQHTLTYKVHYGSFLCKRHYFDCASKDRG